MKTKLRDLCIKYFLVFSSPQSIRGKQKFIFSAPIVRNITLIIKHSSAN